MRANPNPPKAALTPRAATKKEKELHAASVVRPIRFPEGCEPVQQLQTGPFSYHYARARTIGSPGDATITVVGKDAMANPETFTGTFSLGNGSNFLTVVATNGEVIDSISLSAITGFGFTDLRQVRISGATVPSVPETGTTLSLLGTSVLALALLRRKLVCLADGSRT